MGDDREWSWVDEDGIEHAVNEDQLALGLSSEEIPAYILVCKRGWAEWLPAMQVAQLAWALPAGQADTPRKATLSEAGERQPPPLQAYPTLKFRAGEIAAGRISPQFETALSMSPAQPPTRPHSVPAPPIAPPPLPPSIKQPTLGSAVGGLAPYDSDSDEPTVQIEPDDLRDGLDIREALQRVAANRDASAAQVLDPPPSAPPSVLQKPAFVARVPSHTTTMRPTRPPARRPSRVGPVLLIVVLVGAASIAFLVWGKNEVRPKQAVSAEVPAPVPSSSAQVKGPQRCSREKKPTRLMEFAKPELKPSIALMPGATELAIGYGQTSRYAVGLLLNTDTLEVEKVFSDYQNSPLLSVVPVINGKNVEFRMERAASTLQSARTLAAKSPFSVGFLQGRVAMRRGKALPKTLWETRWGAFSVPASARISASSHALVFRAGGERGSILLGVVDDSGQARGKLMELALSAKRVGEPDFVRNLTTGYVVLEGGPQSSKGQIYVGRARLPSLPTSAQLVNTSEHSSDPALAAFDPVGFLLQWTEGVPGAQSIVAKVYDDELHSDQAPMELSPSGRDAHHGSVFVVGHRVFSFFMVRSGENHELWGTSLLCE